MVTAFEFDKYLEHTKEDAYRMHQNEKNFSSLKVFLLIFTIFIGFMLMTTFFDGTIEYDSYSTFIFFTGALLMRIFYNKIFSTKGMRKRLYSLIIAVLLIFLFSSILSSFFPPEEDVNNQLNENVAKEKNNPKGLTINVDTKKENTSSGVIIFIIALLFFRFPKSDLIQLYSIVVGLPLLTDIVFFQNYEVVQKLPELIFASLGFVISYTTENKRQKRFYYEYHVYYKRHYDSVRMRKELNYARELQLSMLPENKKIIGGLCIAALSNPASEVGGDYYDYFRINDYTTGIFICDVSGHGVGSALLLSGLRSCMHLILEETSNPKIIFDKLNRVIRKTQNRKMFVTAVFAVLDTKDNKCHLFNAGHLPPFRISDEMKELYKIKKHGIALGAVDKFLTGEVEEVISFDFTAGDKLFLYTDGVTEAMNVNRDEFGEERLQDFLYRNSDKSPEEMISNLMEEIKYFSGEYEQSDDISLLVILREK